MKIMLMAPPFYKFLGSHNNHNRIGQGILSAILRKAGHEVVQYIADYSDAKKFATLKQMMDRSKIFPQLIADITNPVYRDIFAAIKNEAPDIVGMTIQAGTVVQSETIAMYCHNNYIRTMVGGPMVMLALDTMLQCQYFDQLVAGEAERVIVQAVEHPGHKVFVGIPPNDINKIPLPDRDNFYKTHKNMYLGSMMTSRGCPFHCPYCAHWVMGGEIRYRTPESMVAEVRHVIETYAQNKFRFFDDTFTLNKPRILEFCKQLWSSGLEAEFTVETRADCLDEVLIDNLARIGMKDIKLGLESGSTKILNKYKKGYTKERIRETFAWLRKHPEVNITANWMFGFPGETNEDLQQTIDFATELDADYYSVSCLVPYPGTDMYDLLSRDESTHWQAMMHTQREPPLNQDLDPKLIDELLSLNERKVRYGDRVGR